MRSLKATDFFPTTWPCSAVARVEAGVPIRQLPLPRPAFYYFLPSSLRAQRYSRERAEYNAGPTEIVALWIQGKVDAPVETLRYAV